MALPAVIPLLLISALGVIDLQQRRIPNSLVALLLLAAAIPAAVGNGPTLTVIAINAALGLALTLPGYIKGVVGGGDVKLMLAVSPLWPTHQLLAIFSIGVLATVAMMALRPAPGFAVERGADKDPGIAEQSPMQRGLPLGTAMAVGFFLYEAVKWAATGFFTF